MCQEIMICQKAANIQYKNKIHDAAAAESRVKYRNQVWWEKSTQPETRVQCLPGPCRGTGATRGIVPADQNKTQFLGGNEVS